MEPLYTFRGNGDGGSVALRIFPAFVEHEHRNYFVAIALGPQIVVQYSKGANLNKVSIGDIDFYCDNNREVYRALLEVIAGSPTPRRLRTALPTGQDSAPDPEDVVESAPVKSTIQDAPVPTRAPTPIRPLTNGVYTNTTEGSTTFLSFSDDGGVSELSTEEKISATNAAKWLAAGVASVSTGEYSIADGIIEFTTTSRTGHATHYKGTLDSPTALELDARNEAYEGHEKYVFVEVDSHR